MLAEQHPGRADQRHELQVADRQHAFFERCPFNGHGYGFARDRPRVLLDPHGRLPERRCRQLLDRDADQAALAGDLGGRLLDHDLEAARLERGWPPGGQLTPQLEQQGPGIARVEGTSAVAADEVAQGTRMAPGEPGHQRCLPGPGLTGDQDEPAVRIIQRALDPLREPLPLDEARLVEI